MAERLAESRAQVFGLPGQLALSNRIGVLKPPLAVDDQQAVVDAVEQRLQPLLPVDQRLDVGLLEAMQCLGHQAETVDQRRQLGDWRARQGNVEIATADLIGNAGEPLDGFAEAACEAVCRDEADQQHRDTGQSEQARQQLCALAAADLGIPDLVVGALLHLHHQLAHVIEGLAQRVVFEQGPLQVVRHLQFIEECRVGIADGLESLPIRFVRGPGDAFGQSGLEHFARLGQRLAVAVFPEENQQVVAQGLAQLLVDFDDAEIVLDQGFLAFRHLHHADQGQRQPQQGDGHQRREPQEKTGSQLHLEFHRPYCLRLR